MPFGASVESDDFEEQFRAAGERNDAEIDAAANGDEPGEFDVETGEPIVPEPKAKKAEKEPLAPDELAARNANLQKALKAERAKVKDFEKRLAALETKPKTEEQRGAYDDAPDENVDPLGAITYWKQQFLKGAEADREFAKKQEENARQVQERNELSTYAKEQEDEFTARQPDYPKAFQFFHQARLLELEELGYKGPLAGKRFAAEMQEMMQALRDDDDAPNPAERIYRLAKKRGYSVDTNRKTLESVKRGLETATTLSTGGASRERTSAALNYDNVSKLKGAAFDKAYEALRAQERRRG